MWKFPQGHRQDAFARVGVVVVQAAEPAQVIVQIDGGDAVKAPEPLLEAAVIGIGKGIRKSANAAHQSSARAMTNASSAAHNDCRTSSRRNCCAL